MEDIEVERETKHCPIPFNGDIGPCECGGCAWYVSVIENEEAKGMCSVKAIAIILGRKE